MRLTNGGIGDSGKAHLAGSAAGKQAVARAHPRRYHGARMKRRIANLKKPAAIQRLARLTVST